MEVPITNVSHSFGLANEESSPEYVNSIRVPHS